MYFKQVVPIVKATRVACHMEPSQDDPDVEVESMDWEQNTAYPINTIVWYNNTPYISIHPVPDNASSPDEEPDFWGIAILSS